MARPPHKHLPQCCRGDPSWGDPAVSWLAGGSTVEGAQLTPPPSLVPITLAEKTVWELIILQRTDKQQKASPPAAQSQRLTSPSPPGVIPPGPAVAFLDGKLGGDGRQGGGLTGHSPATVQSLARRACTASIHARPASLTRDPSPGSSPTLPSQTRV